LGTLIGFVNFDAVLEGFFKLGHMGDGKDAGKIGSNGVNGGN
jgi:hypothetical protein